MRNPARRMLNTWGLKPALALLCATAALACAVSAPDEACAYYYDYDTANTAQQEVSTDGAPIAGSAIPDGVYPVGARTSSRMCILYSSAEDCNANVNREKCFISVEGGNITAVFWTSKAYTRLCLGTGEYAASLSDETGTNDAPYMVGDPAEGYVPHLYTLPVNALNEPIVFSTFDGANRSIEEAKWYTRTVAFTPTDEVMRAINGDTGDAGDQGADTGDAMAGDSGDGTPGNAAGDDAQGGAAGSDARNPASASRQPAATPAAGGGDANAAGNGGGSSASAEPAQEQPGQTNSQAAANRNQKRGIPIALAEAAAPSAPTAIQQAEPREDAPKGLSPAQVLGLVVGGILIAGFAARMIIFTMSKRGVTLTRNR